MEYFEFCGEKSSDKNLELLGYNVDLLPERNVEYIEIPKRDGSIRFDDNTYKDRIVEVEAAVLGENETDLLINARAIERWLSQHGRLSFWNEKQRFYVGSLVNQVPLDQQVKWGYLQLMFRCEPYAYFIKTMEEGVTWQDDIPWTEQITWSNASAVHDIKGPTTITITNDGAFPLKPDIKIEGSFKKLYIGGMVINKPLQDGVLYIDNENMLIYSIVNGTRVNYLPYTTGSLSFMSLDVGDNEVEINGEELNIKLAYLSRVRW